MIFDDDSRTAVRVLNKKICHTRLTKTETTILCDFSEIQQNTYIGPIKS